jgi:hypothetical protein
MPLVIPAVWTHLSIYMDIFAAITTWLLVFGLLQGSGLFKLSFLQFHNVIGSSFYSAYLSLLQE